MPYLTEHCNGTELNQWMMHVQTLLILSYIWQGCFFFFLTSVSAGTIQYSTNSTEHHSFTAWAVQSLVFKSRRFFTQHRAQELCESWGGHPGPYKPTVSVDVKQHFNNITQLLEVNGFNAWEPARSCFYDEFKYSMKLKGSWDLHR